MNAHDSDTLTGLRAALIGTRLEAEQTLASKPTATGPGLDNTLPPVVADRDRGVEHSLPSTETQAINAVDECLRQARAEALALLESAIAANSRAAAIHEELQREISNRKQLERALHDTQQRYRRVMNAIGG